MLSWFREMLHDDLGEYGVSPETAALVDAYLYGKVCEAGHAVQYHPYRRGRGYEHTVYQRTREEDSTWNESHD